VLLYHFCVGWDFPLAVLKRVRARRVLRYHNITPPGFFEGWSPGYVAACADGRSQIEAYAKMRCELYLGDSPFNLEDFLEHGVDPARCAVVPPFHKVEELVASEPDPRRIPSTNAPLLLMVGRIAPNKGDLDLIDALAVYRRSSNVDARLLRVGKLDPNLASYGEAVRRRAAELDVEASIVGLPGATIAELRAAYAAADSFVMLSSHEGFCVPLVEAMALGTPIVAYGSSAIGWTVGDAGLVWDSTDPHLVAASLARLAADRELRNELRERGLTRYRSMYSPDALMRALSAALVRLERP